VTDSLAAIFVAFNYELSEKLYICFLFQLQSVEIFENGAVVAKQR